ncbi:MAG: hypothetical protein ACLQJF_13700 [Candidatus Sulfotelmatobacter sp.]
MQTPHRFRSKRQLWTYSGLGIETHDSAQYSFVRGQLQRSKKPQQVRGLNRNHNHEMKEIFKSAATRASCGRGPLSGCQVRFSAYIGWIQAGKIDDETNLPQLDRGSSSLQNGHRGSWVLSIERQLCLNRGQPKRLHLGVQREAFPQVLGQRLGSCRIARHGERKRGFDLCALTGRSELQPLCC